MLSYDFISGEILCSISFNLVYPTIFHIVMFIIICDGYCLPISRHLWYWCQLVFAHYYLTAILLLCCSYLVCASTELTPWLTAYIVSHLFLSHWSHTSAVLVSLTQTAFLCSNHAFWFYGCSHSKSLLCLCSYSWSSAVTETI